MPEKVSVCPYCEGTDPHQGPTGCPPIQWPPEPSRAIYRPDREREVFKVESAKLDAARRLAERNRRA